MPQPENDLTIELQELATEASRTRRLALLHVLKAFLSHVSTGLPDVFRETFHTAGIVPESDADEIWSRLLRRSPAKEDQKRSIDVLRNSLRFLCQQLVNPTNDRPAFIVQLLPHLLVWVQTVQQDMGLKLTPSREDDKRSEWIPGSFTDECRDPLKVAIKHEQEAQILVSDLIRAAYTGTVGGKPCNPLLKIVRRVRNRRPGHSPSVEELLSDAIQRLYSRIDAFNSDRRFEPWWDSLTDKCLLDMFKVGVSGSGDFDADSLEGNSPTSISADGLHQKLFSDDDWAVIRSWAELDPGIPVVILTGFGWITKAKLHPNHWQDLCHWLNGYGVQDIDGFANQTDEAEWSTTGQLKLLAQYSGRTYNTVRGVFHRKFGGLRQTTRQSSFGHKHRVVELDFYWQVEVFSSGQFTSDLVQELNQTATAGRVAAMCCVPAWHLVQHRHVWQAYVSDYPFVTVPPLMEFLKSDFEIKPDEAEVLPPQIQNNVQVQAYFREQILVHATKGNLNDARESVRAARSSAEVLEPKLRGYLVNSERG